MYSIRPSTLGEEPPISAFKRYEDILLPRLDYRFEKEEYKVDPKEIITRRLGINDPQTSAEYNSIINDGAKGLVFDKMDKIYEDRVIKYRSDDDGSDKNKTLDQRLAQIKIEINECMQKSLYHHKNTELLLQTLQTDTKDKGGFTFDAEDEEVLRRCKEKLDLFRDMNGKRFYKTDKFLK
jgi:hypothetical protein